MNFKEAVRSDKVEGGNKLKLKFRSWRDWFGSLNTRSAKAESANIGKEQERDNEAGNSTEAFVDVMEGLTSADKLLLNAVQSDKVNQLPLMMRRLGKKLQDLLAGLDDEREKDREEDAVNEVTDKIDNVLRFFDFLG